MALGAAALSASGCGAILGIHDIEPPTDAGLPGNPEASDATMVDGGLEVDGSGSGGTDAKADTGSGVGEGGGESRDAMQDGPSSPPSDSGIVCRTADKSCGPSCQDCTATGATCHGHHNGLGQTFYDCNPVGTYNQEQAMEACAAYTGSSTQCQATTIFRCALLSFSTATVVCSTGSSCYCWEWNVTPGSVGSSSFGGCPACPTSSPTWD
jgi:hypothetical protein